MQIDPIQLLQSALDLTLFSYLREVFAEDPTALLIVNILVVLSLATVPLLSVFVVGWVERKVLARMQDRIGPNRVGGRYGLLQMVADVVKMMTKEVIVPAGADKWAYFAAPILALMTSVLLFAALPLAPAVIGVDLNIAVFYFLAISSVSVVAILLAGWGSNNKYALLGAFRAVAQLVSYEVPMILSLLVPIILARTMSTVGLVEAQNIPFIVFVPVAALVFFISALAETGRSPFDLLEAESEIVAGFHTEYTGMYFGLFMAGEYIAIMFMCIFFSTAFLGGYRFFGLEELVVGNGFYLGNLLGAAALLLKSAGIFFIFMWLRGTLPRFRIDQLLNFNWKFMVPLSLALLFTVAILDKLIFIWFPNVPDLGRALIHLLSNLLIAAVTIELVRYRIKRQRQTEEISEETETAPELEPAPAH
ncbi:MAG: NADH-quinone oxidoreductase subunit NuoH [Chloroflexi bacterium]|nr:NADH-quinone oxidoreductase subunit NuoH [Chloroflexota bacterium]